MARLIILAIVKVSDVKVLSVLLWIDKKPSTLKVVGLVVNSAINSAVLDVVLAIELHEATCLILKIKRIHQLVIVEKPGAS